MPNPLDHLITAAVDALGTPDASAAFGNGHVSDTRQSCTQTTTPQPENAQPSRQAEFSDKTITGLRPTTAPASAPPFSISALVSWVSSALTPRGQVVAPEYTDTPPKKDAPRS